MTAAITSLGEPPPEALDPARTPRPGSTVSFLLDVDGVVNVFAVPDEGTFRIETLSVAGGWFNVTVGTHVIEAVRRWAADPRMDVRWCTTWHDHANDELAPAVGMPRLPVAPGRRDDGYWKLHHAMRLVAAGRPLVWCDDTWAAHPMTAASLPPAPAGVLLIQPDPFVGLTVADIARIDEFVTRATATA